MGQTVAHLTDFSEASAEAFLHALALALAYKHRLYLLHVKDPKVKTRGHHFLMFGKLLRVGA